MQLGLNPEGKMKMNKNDKEDKADIRHQSDSERINDDDDDEFEDPLDEGNRKVPVNNLIKAGIIIGVGIAVVFCFLLIKKNNSKEVSENTKNTVAEETKKDINENPLAVYDEHGKLISSNGVYDLDGNLLEDTEETIKPGATDFQSGNDKTSPIVYSATDFIKDLNGVDIAAVYNVKSYEYVEDYVNYEKRRAIVSNGMELYWLEVTYKGRAYKCTIPFWRFQALDNTGICKVRIEVLILEGGENIISYMNVINDTNETSK